MKRIKCDICNEFFSNKKSMSNHKRWHEISKYKTFQKKWLGLNRLNYVKKLNVNKSLAWLLGVFCGDAFISENVIRLSTVDKDFANKFKKIGYSIIKRKPKEWVTVPENKNHNTVYTIAFYYKPFIKRLIQRYDSFKKEEWRVPEGIIRGNRKLQIEFIKGIFDSEGCFYIQRGIKYNKIRISITSTNKPQFKVIQQIIKKIGIDIICHERKKRIDLCIYNRKDLLLFKNIIGFTIKRKQKALKKALKNFHWSRNEYNRRWENKIIGRKKITSYLKTNYNTNLELLQKKLKCNFYSYFDSFKKLKREVIK